MNRGLNIKRSLQELYEYRHRPESMRAFADLYWRTLLYMASITSVIVVTLGIVELSAVLRDWGVVNTDSGGIVQPVPKLDKAQLQGTLDKFDARTQRFESLKTAPLKIADPSK
ncbi:MAG: hypothetical protein NUV88_02575 [Candidatus Kaiserbacteria bacterium]|nr:hypothetical protein [Candidatus Kaiserbacteria bacterium]